MAILLSMKTVGELLEKNARNYGNKDAVIYVDENIRYTWRQLNRFVDEAAKGFLALGVKRGEHIAIWGTNRPEWLITQFAAAKIGAVLVTINPEWKSEELEYVLKQSDSKILVMQKRFIKESGEKSFSYDYIKIFQKIAPEIIKCEPENLKIEKLPMLKCIILISKEKEKGMLKWDSLLSKTNMISEKEYTRRKKSINPHDTILIQYTSGTTGFPKGAALSHFNIVNNALTQAKNMELTSKDRMCGPVPYYHIFGSTLLNIVCLAASAVTIIPAEHFNARKTLEAVEKEKCTAICGVPTMFIAELADSEFSRFNLNSLRTGAIAGASCPIQLMNDIVFKMGAGQITILYGLSEACAITQTRPEDPIERRVSSVGKPLDYVEVKIVDPESFKEVGIKETGEIWAKGYNIMSGYYKMPEETANAIVDGWLRTGDLGTKDKEGYYNIVGRLKDMIIVGGHKVYPAEIESNLREIFNEIEDVYAVGIPHEELGEVVAAVIKLRKNESLTLTRIKEEYSKHAEWTKVPRYAKFVDDFAMAMTVTGKIQKKKLKEILIKELGLEELAKIKTA